MKQEGSVSGDTISHDIPFIDLIRGGASLIVVIAHVGLAIWPGLTKLWFSFGAFAVDLFIIVSGFLMTVSLCRNGEPKPLETRNILSFYVRRFFRISPAFYFAYAGSLLLMFSGFWSVVLHLTYLYGLSSLHSVDGVIVPFWSISLEMQFYLAIPFILAAFRYLNATVVLLVCCLVGVIFGRMFGIYGYQGWLGSYPLPTLLPLGIGFFIVGIVLALHFIQSRHAPGFGSSVAIIVATSLIYPSFKHIYLATGGALMVLLFIKPPSRIDQWTRSIASRVSHFLRRVATIRYLADYSYSLYLFHAFVIIFLFQRTHALFWLDQVPRPVAFLVATLIVLAVGYAIAAGVFELIEKPGVRLGRRLERKIFGRPEDRRVVPFVER